MAPAGSARIVQNKKHAVMVARKNRSDGQLRRTHASSQLVYVPCSVPTPLRPQGGAPDPWGTRAGGLQDALPPPPSGQVTLAPRPP
eukprot:6746830-Prymnesium_polylepis.2